MPLLRIDAFMIPQCFEVVVFRFILHKGLLIKERMELIKSWQHSGFGVYLDRIGYERDKGIVNYSTDKFSVLEFDILDFIARLSVQVPDPYERLLDYYGIYSNASVRRKQIPGETSESEKKKSQVESSDKSKLTSK